VELYFEITELVYPQLISLKLPPGLLQRQTIIP